MGWLDKLWRGIGRAAAGGSPLMEAAGRAAALAAVNVCFLLGCLPVVTAPAAAAGLWTVLLAPERPGFEQVPGLFFRGLRRRGLAAEAAALVLAAPGALVAWSLILALGRGLENRFSVMAPLSLAAAVYLVGAVWLIPVLCAGDGSWRRALRTAFLLGLRELWRSAVLAAAGAVSLAALAVCLDRGAGLLGLWLLWGVSVPAAAAQRAVRPVLCPKAEE